LKIYIENMVSNRCKMVVREELKKLGLHFIFVELGEIEVMENISEEKKGILKMELRKSGLELLDDLNAILIENIKNTIIELIYKTDDLLKINYNNYLSEKFKMNYNYLSDLFVNIQGIKINQYILNHKIERIKEMIIYDELSILEIAQKLNFSNIADLYVQFKKATGLSPYNFKLLRVKKSNIIENVDNFRTNI